MPKRKYRVYNSYTAQQITVKAKNTKAAIAQGKKKLRKNIKGIVRAYRVIK